MQRMTSTTTTLSSRERTILAAHPPELADGRPDAIGASAASAESIGGSGSDKPLLLELLQELCCDRTRRNDLDTCVDDVVFQSHALLVELGLQVVERRRIPLAVDAVQEHGC